jgi:hypothetical protein
MRVLLLHPDDAFNDSWGGQHWDAVIDLGRAPKSFYGEQSEKLGCPVFSIFELAVEVEDLQTSRPLLELGMGHVVDRFGIDWWDIISLQLQPELQEVRLALRLAKKIKGCRTLVASRPSITAEVLRLHLDIPLHLLDRSLRNRLLDSVVQRGVAAIDLGYIQLRQVVYDKYDPHYRWRRTVLGSSLGRSSPGAEPLVLLPSAYSNVTKTELSYARILPQQQFLLVLARESGAISPVPPNVATARLASFASKSCDFAELRTLEDGWKDLEQRLQNRAEFELAIQTRILSKGPRWLRWGMAVRDAWLKVFETRSVTGCLSADDSNPYTRIPLLLAEHRGIPAIASHHGALDFRMAFKNLRFSSYLAKGEMEVDYLNRICGVDAERVRIGAPPFSSQELASQWNDAAPWITFFTEPYESDFWRVEPIYKELLPRLCAVARKAGKTIVLKLHPFESARQRQRLVARCLNSDDRKLVEVIKAPLSREILGKTWCAVTVESSVAFECAGVGIPSFLCAWLRNAYSGYVPQYIRFGVGRPLESADDLLRIPEMLGEAMPDSNIKHKLVRTISAATLLELLRHPDKTEARPRRSTANLTNANSKGGAQGHNP